MAFSYTQLDYTLDPIPQEALEWAQEAQAAHVAARLLDEPFYLSCDIETPDKDTEEDALAIEDGTDYVIDRCGYSYKPGHALSIPWGGTYEPVHKLLLGADCTHVWWNGSFDIPRITANNLIIGGSNIDAMEAWHVLNSDLKKSLGFVAPFFAKNYPMWKHTSHTDPAKYNAMDADVAGIILRGVIPLLKQHGLWGVFEKYVLEMEPIFARMSRAGMPVDYGKRMESAKQLQQRFDAVRGKIEAEVPDDIRVYSPAGGYVRPPAVLDGLVCITVDGVKERFCENCGAVNPGKPHTRAYKKKLNPCAGAQVSTRTVGAQRWARPVPFIPSTKGILRYQQYRKHPVITTGRGEDRRATTEEKALRKLIGRYPEDRFYPLVLEDRELTKLRGTYLGTYISDEAGERITGGFPVGRDGRVHPHFRNTPSTLRTSCVGPNLQNLPRGDDSEIQRWVKGMFVAAEGHTFIAKDFKGIEAQLVGVHAGDKDYLRLAKGDIHSFFTAHNLYRLGKIPASDLPQITWSDADLIGWGKQFKARFNSERNIGKRCIHAGNYRIGAHKLHEEYPLWFPKVKDATGVLAFYYELFPSISRWHERICRQVDKSAVYRNSFGHVHRFYQVLKWERQGSDWVWSYGDDAKRLIAFGPQSDAAFIGRAALKRLYYDYPETMAQWLRLFIHDEIFCEVHKTNEDRCMELLTLEMERPIPEIPLDPSWGFGDHLVVESEGKQGNCWAEMR